MNSKRCGGTSYRDIMLINIIMFMNDCTVSKIADLLNVSKSAITVRVNKLTEQGMILKQKNVNDGRSSILTAAPKVYTLYRDEDKSINYALTKICESYSLEEIKLFSTMLDDLSVHLLETEPRADFPMDIPPNLRDQMETGPK